MKKCPSYLFWMFVGWATVFGVKYLVVGLRQWDVMFHPERLTADTTGPWARFAPPFMGILGGGSNGGPGPTF